MVQHYFAAFDEKHFLLSDIVQDLPVVTDMHVPTLSRMLNVLRLLVLDLCEALQILCFFIHSAQLCNRTLLRRVNADYSDSFISVKPVVPKYFRAVTLIKVAIMSYYPQYFAVIAHNTEQHFGSAVPPKSGVLPPVVIYPIFANQWVKRYNRVFAQDSRISNHSNVKKIARLIAQTGYFNRNVILIFRFKHSFRAALT